MRLTLRNMLASMDEILEPAQQEEIKRKIEESEFATGVMHRIRDVTRRIRLGAPKLTGKGMGLDPNTVSMYLDNTLSADRVPDFEKVCLESDIHLAEVAACHQVLALVLGEPAEVDADLRRKLYEIGESATASGAEAPKLPPPLPAITPRVARRERPRVPDYLREDRRSRFWAIAGTILLALLLIAGVIRAIGPYDGTNRALAWLPIWDDEEVAVNDQQNAIPSDNSAQNGDGPANTVANANSDATAPTNENTAPTDTAATVKNAALINPLDQGNNTIAVDRSKAPVNDIEQAPLPPEPDNAKASSNTAKAKSEQPDSLPDVLPVEVKSGQGTSIRNPPLDTDSEAPRRGAEPVGRFLTDPNVLLRLNGAGEWERVEQGATLTAGDRLLVLPTYRPSITLSGGLTLQVLGETMVELLPSDANGVARLRMPYGRLVLMTAGKPDVAIHLLLGGQEGTAKFVDANSTLAAEVRPFLPAGANPEQEKAYVAVDLFVPSGQIDWHQKGSAEPKQIMGPGHVLLGTAYPYVAADEPELPAWIVAEKLGGLDEMASGDMNRALSDGSRNKRPVALTIRELAEHRRVELKYFGARSLALMDEFDFFIPAFNDNDQRAVWPRQIESLRAALARGAETAAKVREAFERQRGDDGFKLYRMLWGYSKADIQSGAAAQLVEYLDHNSLDFRVLAIYALRSVQGVPPNYSSYQPGAPAAELQQQVRRWREYIKEGPLSPKGALDRPGPLPKSQAPVAEPPIGEDESARIPRTVPILR